MTLFATAATGSAPTGRPDAPDRRTRRGERTRWAPVTVVAIVLAGLLLLAAIFGPHLCPHNPTVGDPAQRLLGFGAQGHLLGTDGQGRDVLSRVLAGARTSLFAGVAPVAAAAILGSTLGICAGLAGRVVSAVIMRTLDMFYPLPLILLAIAISASLGPSLRNVVISLTVVLIPPIARVVHGEVARLSDTGYMRAARCSGASRLRIAWTHVVPNIRATVLVYCTSLVGLTIVDAAGLAFLGLGVAPPTADWGLMLNEAQRYFFRNPAVALVPALSIFLAAAVFNVLGNRLKEELGGREVRR